MTTGQTFSERADALEHQQIQELGNRIATKSLLYNLADGDRSLGHLPFLDGNRLLLAARRPRPEVTLEVLGCGVAHVLEAFIASRGLDKDIDCLLYTSPSPRD